MADDIYQSKNCMTKNKQKQHVNSDPINLLISLFQLVEHIAAVSDSPDFIVYQRGQEVGRFLFIEFYPNSTLALSKQLYITPSHSTNSCFLRWQIKKKISCHSFCSDFIFFHLITSTKEVI